MLLALGCRNREIDDQSKKGVEQRLKIGRSFRELRSWMALATNSLTTPVPPSSRKAASIFLALRGELVMTDDRTKPF